MGSRLYGVGKGKRKLVSKNGFSPRQTAVMVRVGMGSEKRGQWRTATLAEMTRWKPKKGRRKAGARRRVSFIRTLFRVIRIPVGRSRRSRRR